MSTCETRLPPRGDDWVVVDERLKALIKDAVREVFAECGLLAERTAPAPRRPIQPRPCAQQAQAQGCEPWEVARDRAEAYIKNHPWPGLNQLASLCGCHHSILRKAVRNSPPLQRAEAEYRLHKAKPVVKSPCNDDPSWEVQVDEALRQLIECASAERRGQLNTPDVREHLRCMQADALATLVKDAQREGLRYGVVQQRARARTPEK